MREAARYVNHRGEEIALNSGDIHLNTGTLPNWKYGYTMRNGRPTDFVRKCEESSIGAVVIGYKTRNDLYYITIQDVAEDKPGRLYINDWFLECYLFRSEKDRTFLGPAADYSMAIIPASEPRWQRIKNYTFYSQASGGGINFDYNFDYNFDNASVDTKIVENESVFPAGMVITVYGPAVNPRLTIAGNLYECEVDIEMGGRLEIDGVSGDIKLFDRWGASENAFNKRRGDPFYDSGSFIFQPLPRGIHSVTTPQSLNLAIEVHELSDEWRWDDDR